MIPTSRANAYQRMAVRGLVETTGTDAAMPSLNHWHPVALSSHLKHQPLGVRVNDTPVVVFRTESGRVGALADYCPHRRMKLSLGSVVGEKLRCQYHGWTFACDGPGESPGTPKLYACAEHFECRESHGAIWVKAPGVAVDFPSFAVDGYFNICNLFHRVQAPLELVVDNFCEIEHTPTTHAFFGYPLERMHEVTVDIQATDDAVRVVNRGPRKRFSTPLRWLLGIGKDYLFMDDWTTYFSPVHSVYDHWWQCPTTGRESMVRWRLYIFFIPSTADETMIFTFAYTKSRYPGPAGGARFFKWLMRRKLDYEIQLDVRILEGLADKNPHIEGMKLSRFDKVLGLNRERIERIYRGKDTTLAPHADRPTRGAAG